MEVHKLKMQYQQNKCLIHVHQVRPWYLELTNETYNILIQCNNWLIDLYKFPGVFLPS